MKKLKIQCENCLNFFPKEEIEELVLTKEKLCQSCYAARKKLHKIDDPYPFP